MSDFTNPDAIAWRDDNERLHRAGVPHQWRLFGMVGCRLCQAEHEAATSEASDHNDQPVLRTRRGRQISESDLDEMAERAERGFDLSTWQPRTRADRTD